MAIPRLFHGILAIGLACSMLESSLADPVALTQPLSHDPYATYDPYYPNDPYSPYEPYYPDDPYAPSPYDPYYPSDPLYPRYPVPCVVRLAHASPPGIYAFFSRQRTRERACLEALHKCRTYLTLSLEPVTGECQIVE